MSIRSKFERFRLDHFGRSLAVKTVYNNKIQHSVFHSIDQFVIVSGVTIVTGWSSEFYAGQELVIVNNGEPLRTVTTSVEQPHLVAQYGDDAEKWGFKAYGILPQKPINAAEIGLEFATGVQIQSLSSLRPEIYTRPYALFSKFVNDVNASGGTVLEMGSRARSGVSRRNLFGPNVKYIGSDVTDGPNVDIVADAHHLSDYIVEPVDFIYSISTFEHFLMPWKVALEMNKVLKLGGKAYCQSHQTWPCHDEPWDYFRFSKEAWTGLFNIHTGFRMCDTSQGEMVVVTSHYNPGGPFDGMDASPGYGMSVCVAEKIAPPLVTWDEPVNVIQKIEYQH